MHDLITVPSMSHPEVKGHVRLELHNAETGALSHAVERDNYVSERWFAGVNKGIQYRFGEFNSAPSTNFSYTRDAIWSTPSGVPFVGLALSDYGGAVNIEERLVEGVVAGGATRGFLSSGAFNGSYNVTESEHSRLYHRFVYDFTTSQGNGTIQSIYTGEFEAGSTDDYLTYDPKGIGDELVLENNYVGDYTARAISPAGSAITKNIIERNDARYLPSGVYYLSKEDQFSTSEVLEGTYWGLPDTDGVGGIATKGDRFYWLAYGGSYSDSTRTIEVRSMAWADIDAQMQIPDSLRGLAFVVEHTFTDADLISLGWTSYDITGSSALLGLGYLEGTNTWFISVNYTGVGFPSAALLEFSATDWSLVNEFTGETGGGAFTIPTFQGSDTVIAIREGFWSLNRAAGTMARTVSLPPNGRASTITPIGSDLAIFFYNYSSSTRFYMYLVSQQQFFSRVLLPAPVTKDSTNTMKVIYEFTIEETDILA